METKNSIPVYEELDLTMRSPPSSQISYQSLGSISPAMTQSNCTRIQNPPVPPPFFSEDLVRCSLLSAAMHTSSNQANRETRNTVPLPLDLVRLTACCLPSSAAGTTHSD